MVEDVTVFDDFDVFTVFFFESLDFVDFEGFEGFTLFFCSLGIGANEGSGDDSLESNDGSLSSAESLSTIPDEVTVFSFADDEDVVVVVVENTFEDAFCSSFLGVLVSGHDHWICTGGGGVDELESESDSFSDWDFNSDPFAPFDFNPFDPLNPLEPPHDQPVVLVLDPFDWVFTVVVPFGFVVEEDLCFLYGLQPNDFSNASSLDWSAWR